MTTASGRPHIIGRQLRSAREMLGLSREDVAVRLHISEEDIERWEADTDEPDVETLWDIADLYHRSPDYFLKPVAETPTHITYRLTARNSLEQLSPETRVVIARFEELCRWQYELEGLIGLQTEANIPQPQARMSAEVAAAMERERFGLNNAPIRKPRKLLEEQHVRIFELPVPGEEFAGFSWWSSAYGPCVLINASDSAGRRSFTLAHEYAHLLRRREATICDLSQENGDENFANRFAAAFLMPEKDLRRVAEERGMVGAMPGATDLIPLANRYGVSIEAAGRRLEELGLIPRGASDARLSEWQGQALFRRRAKKPGWRRRLGEPFVSTAFTAYSRGAISLSRLSQLLDLDIRKTKEVYRKQAEEPGLDQLAVAEENLLNLYVFDATCLIELERKGSQSILKNLGDRVCIPTRVEREVNKPRTALESWFRKNPRAVKRFVPGSREEELYYKLTLESGPRLGDGEAAAIAMAANRSATLVTDDKAAVDVAQSMGVTCIDTNAFLDTLLLQFVQQVAMVKLRSKTEIGRIYLAMTQPEAGPVRAPEAPGNVTWLQGSG